MSIEDIRKKLNKERESINNKYNSGSSLDLSNNLSFDDYEEYEQVYKKHIKDILFELQSEIEQKRRFRWITLILAIVLLIVFSIAVGYLYFVLLHRENFVFSDKLLIGISVTVFLSIVSLINIIFKYSFSKTKDNTDYINSVFKTIKDIKGFKK